MSVNKVILVGRLGQDPVVKYMTNGEAVANCSIACNERFKDKNGDKQERVEFVNLVFYRRLAEIIGEYVKKGALLYVEGKLQTRKWQDKEGKDRYTTEIIVNEMQMLGGKSQGGDTAAQPERKAQPAPAEKGIGFDNFDSDIPF